MSSKFVEINKKLADARGLKISPKAMPSNQNMQAIEIDQGGMSSLIILLIITLNLVFTLAYMHLSAPTAVMCGDGDVYISAPRTLHYLNPQPQDIECAQLVPIQQSKSQLSRCSCDSELYQPLIGPVKSSENQQRGTSLWMNKKERIIFV